MGVSTETIKRNIDRLIDEGTILTGFLSSNTDDEQTEDIFIKMRIDSNTTSLGAMYEPWYSEALPVIKTFIPDRLSDFILLYKNENK